MARKSTEILTSQWVLQIPRALVRKQIGAVERFTAIAVSKESSIGVITRDFVGFLARNFESLDPSVAQRLTEQATEMAMMSFMTASSDSAHDVSPIPAGKSMLAHRARIFIEGRLRDSTLKPIPVADHLGISTRYLNAVFAMHGHSVERFIWDRRIAKCTRDLMDPGQQGRTIGDIAFSWGFRSLAHFSQAFRAAQVRYRLTHIDCAAR